MAKRVTIEQWIVEALSDGDKGGPCTTLSLVFVKAAGSSEEIHSKSLSGATHQPRQLAELFMNKATGYAQDLPGISTFKMLAFYAGRDQPQASFPFTVADGEMTTGGNSAFAKHEPTNQGLLAQMMKHTEEMARMVIDICKTTTVQALTREEALRKENHEATLVVRDVIMNMAKDQHNARMEELKFSRESKERELLGKALPTIINQLTGREMMPQSHADTELIDALAMSIQPEHMKMLIASGILPADKAAMLAARFNLTLEKAQQERAAYRALPSEETAEQTAAQ